MKPDRMASKWVKVRPWYYTERKTPSRNDALKEAISTDKEASEDFLQET